MSKASQITSFRSGLLWIPKATTAADQWDSINWKAVYKRINKLQARITTATRRGNRNLAKKLQYLLTSSFDAKLLAEKKVTSNKGKRTSGIDKKRWSTPSTKYKAALSLKTKGYKAEEIPKNGKIGLSPTQQPFRSGRGPFRSRRGTFDSQGGGGFNLRGYEIHTEGL